MVKRRVMREGILQSLGCDCLGLDDEQVEGCPGEPKCEALVHRVNFCSGVDWPCEEIHVCVQHRYRLTFCWRCWT